MLALALSTLWIAALSACIEIERSASASTLTWLNGHFFLCATTLAVVSAVLVSRRREHNRVSASRAWTAALPIARSTARWQAIAIHSEPALLVAGCLAISLGTVQLVAWVTPGVPSPGIVWLAATLGVIAGALVAQLLPNVRPEEIYEGSRYVPHARRASTSIPTGSLAPLGTWPVRHAFASARPKTISRVLLLVLLGIPLGSTAAGAMLAIGLVAVIGALMLLLSAAISVSAQAARWLKPLPLAWTRQASTILTRSFALMSCAAALESWLLWILGSSPRRSFATAALTLAAGVILAGGGAVLAIRRSRRGNDGRL